MKLRSVSRFSLRVAARRARVAILLAWLAAALLGVRAQTDGALPGGPLILLAGCLALMLHSGIGARDLRRGCADLWLQTGVSRPGFALARLAEAMFLTVFALVPASLLYGAGRPELGAVLATTLPLAVLTGCMVGSVTMGLSGWGVRPDVLWALLTVLYLGALGHDALVAPEQFGVWGPVLRALRFPFLEAHSLAAWSPGLPIPWAAMPRPLAYWGVWALGGALGTEVRTRRYRSPEG